MFSFLCSSWCIILHRCSNRWSDDPFSRLNEPFNFPILRTVFRSANDWSDPAPNLYLSFVASKLADSYQYYFPAVRPRHCWALGSPLVIMVFRGNITVRYVRINYPVPFTRQFIWVIAISGNFPNHDNQLTQIGPIRTYETTRLQRKRCHNSDDYSNWVW